MITLFENSPIHVFCMHVHIVYATVCFVQEIQTEYKLRGSRDLCDGLHFENKKKVWHVLYLCQSCVETGHHLR